MENAINFVRGEAEKHFSNSINCCLFHALLYHTSQKYCSGDGWHVFEERRHLNLCWLQQERGRAAEETLKLCFLNPTGPLSM